MFQVIIFISALLVSLESLVIFDRFVANRFRALHTFPFAVWKRKFGPDTSRSDLSIIQMLPRSGLASLQTTQDTRYAQTPLWAQSQADPSWVTGNPFQPLPTVRWSNTTTMGPGYYKSPEQYIKRAHSSVVLPQTLYPSRPWYLLRAKEKRR